MTDIILPTIKNFDLDDAACIYFPSKRAIYISCKSSSDEAANNKQIVFYINSGGDENVVGDISIDDINVRDYIVDADKLYFLSSVNQNTYEMFTRNSADGEKLSHKIVTKEFTFNEPARGKEFNTLYIEGFIAEKTKMKVTILYGILGSSGEKSHTISQTDDFVNTTKVSALGDAILGDLSLGKSQAAISDSFPFSVPLHFDISKATRYKIRVETVFDDPDDYDTESFWAVSNISTNPALGTIMKNKQEISNS